MVDALKDAVHAVARSVPEKQREQAAGSSDTGIGHAEGDVAPKDWSPVIAAAKYLQCVNCNKIWHKSEEVFEVPEQDVVIVNFRCSACAPLITDATAEEREAKRLRLAKDVV